MKDRNIKDAFNIDKLLDEVEEKAKRKSRKKETMIYTGISKKK